MRKLLILLLVAAAIGIVISRDRAADPPRGESGVAPRGRDIAGGGALPETTTAERAPEPRRTQRAHPPAEPREVAASRPPSSIQAKQTSPPGRETAGPIVLSARAPARSSSAGQQAPGAARSVPDEQAMAGELKRALALVDAGRWIEARAILSALYLESTGRFARQVRDVLDRINQKLVFDPRCIDGAQVHVVERGDNLIKIAKKYGVNWRMIARINRIQPDRIRAEQQLKILTGRTSAVVWKGEFRLALLLDGVYVKEYPVGIGKDELTPSGELTVADMMVRADWYPPEGGVIKYGEEGYQLGERWIAFADEPGASGLGIHGTDDEASIGTKCSNGCIRLRNDDVIELYDFMQPGSRVLIKD